MTDKIEIDGVEYPKLAVTDIPVDAWCVPCQDGLVTLGKITQEDIKSLLFNMPAEWRTRWCEPGEDGCGCMGCANASGGLARLGYTKEQWREALEKIK